jgi:hypothetical protein
MLYSDIRSQDLYKHVTMTSAQLSHAEALLNAEPSKVPFPSLSPSPSILTLFVAVRRRP